MIYHEIYGEGEPIVLLHGWAMHLGIWREFAQTLAQYYQVIAIDLPNHGRSDRLAVFDLNHIVNELTPLIPKQCCIIGWSLGATVAIQLAHSLPQQIKGVMIICGNPCFVATEMWPGMRLALLQQFGQRLINNTSQTLSSFLALQVLGLENAKTLTQQLKSALGETEMPDILSLQQGLALLQFTNLIPILTELTAPIAVVLGQRDTLIPVEVGAAIQAIQPQTQLHIFPKAAHIPFISHSQELIQKIHLFMESVRFVH
ncbi:MAG: pimeloyl-[acyl-carrier protein] methyl ester esterase [Pseudomonadota bacterium]|jgi:pimeloyl-[acyl-carrier protein] methyl ester esterase